MKADTANPIARDFKNVVDDAQELLRTVEHTGEAKFEEAKLAGRRYAKRGDQYVHSHPWQAVGVGAALGAVVGFLIARR